MRDSLTNVASSNELIFEIRHQWKQLSIYEVDCIKVYNEDIYCLLNSNSPLC